MTQPPPLKAPDTVPTPADGVNLNVEGREVISQHQGFGPLWRKTYWVELRGADVSPQQVIRVWKDRFDEFQPHYNRFFTSSRGVQPGEVMLIHSAPLGMPPLCSGVVVADCDHDHFTIVTPRGFPEAGSNTFSARAASGVTVAQVQSLARTTDPLYEFGFRLIGAQQQEAIWTHVLKALSAHFGVPDAGVLIQRDCVDERVLWRGATNVWHNAMIRTTVAAPFLWLGGKLRPSAR